MSKEMLRALDVLEEEKGVSKEVVIEAIELALVSAYKRHYGQAQNVEISFDQKKGNVHVYAVKEVVEYVFDSTLEVSIQEALTLNKAYEVGDKIRFEVTPKDFGRIAAQTAKQVIMQRIREAEREIIFNEYIQYESDILTGIVERQDQRYIYVNLGKIEAVLSKQDQMPNESYHSHDRIKVFVSKVENTTKGPQVYVSRSHPDLVKRLFEQEVPEIYDGVVEIVSVAREAGDRSKVAVRSYDNNIDPVGTCVGPKGQRVQVIVDELSGENMDIVAWNEDPAVFIANALNPAQVDDVIFNTDNSCIVVVPDSQLSLAIGKRGQNVRLAARLTNKKIDIKSESDYQVYLEEQEALAAQAALEAEQAALEESEQADQEAVATVEESLNAESQASSAEAGQENLEAADLATEATESTEEVEPAEAVESTEEAESEEVAEETEQEETSEAAEETAETEA